MKRKHQIALFIVYFLIFFTSAAMINYYAYLTLDGRLLFAASVVLALAATYLHNRWHVKTKADELAEEIEEIL
jgi:membrane protein implicated in regulation of membrane protease activity